MKKTWSVPVLLVLAGCAGAPQQGGGGVERMYVIECGENHVNDVSRWTPGVNVGKPMVFSNHCYLIRHARGWMLWDTGNSDSLAAMPNGRTNPAGTITAFMKKPLADSLKELGVAPGDIKYLATSHSHGDHVGNVGLFSAATLYVQRGEYALMPEQVRGNPGMILDGDFDVFGDGSVTIKSAPGHTPGHQVLAVRLPKTGPVLLTGDMVHLQHSWNYRVAPSFNFNVPQSMATIDAMKAYAQRTGSQVWINHDRESHAKIPKAPAFVE
jgi:glyoxylase-like metal-dependent hydrolase (beta-lactamase superfamily II)